MPLAPLLNNQLQFHLDAYLSIALLQRKKTQQSKQYILGMFLINSRKLNYDHVFMHMKAKNKHFRFLPTYVNLL